MKNKYPFKKEIEERINNLETSKEICEKKLKDVLILIKQEKLKTRKFFIQEITHKNGFGGGTEKKDVIEYVIAYFDGSVCTPRVPYVFNKQDTVVEILEILKKEVAIY